MRFYFNNRLFLDYTCAAIMSALVAFQPYKGIEIFIWPVGDRLTTLALAIASSSASLLGFVLAANTFLISHTQHRRLNVLRQSSGFAQLLNIMKSNLWRLFGLTLLAGMSALVTPSVVHFALIGTTFLLVLSTMALATLIWATMSVLAIPLD